MLASLFSAGAFSEYPLNQERQLDFGQFSTVVAVDELNFMDKLKLATMEIVKAPAAERIVFLYKYSAEDIKNINCSDYELGKLGKLGSYRALLVRPTQNNGEPKWREVSFANSCNLQKELQKIIDTLSDEAGWLPVQDKKLESIINTENATKNNAPDIDIILTKPLSSGHLQQYFAECKPGETGATLCARNRN